MHTLRPILWACVASTLMSAVFGASSAAREPEPEWRLVWSDEFDTNGPPNPRDWSFEHGFVRNEEAQYYQDDNARCENGMLVIEARRERRRNEAYVAGDPDWRRNREYAEYTSSSLTTRRSHAWKYGRFEMRARIDTRSGMWPAFWTLGTSGHWPACGEIDIMEYYRGTVLANVAWASANRGEAAWDAVRVPLGELGGSNWSDEFHVWRMDWDRRAIRLYVDDRLVNETTLDGTFNASGKRFNPLRQPHFILLNLALGGTNGGDLSATEFPARYEIDYVRVYRRRS